jgi:hypothetical protein
MRKDYIEVHQIAERYLQGKLSESEEAEFEERFLGNPELLDELELAEKLQQGLQDVAIVETLHKKARPGSRSASFFRTPQYAAAATVFLFVSMAVSTVLYQRVERLSEIVQMAPRGAAVGYDPRGAPPFGITRAGGRGDHPSVMSFGSTRIIAVLATRGAPTNEPITRFSPEEGEEVVLLVDPGPASYPRYRMTVYRQDAADAEEPVWQRDSIVAGYQDMVALSIPGTRLEVGDYLIRVEGWSEERPAGQEYEYLTEVRFRIVPRQ